MIGVEVGGVEPPALRVQITFAGTVPPPPPHSNYVATFGLRGNPQKCLDDHTGRGSETCYNQHRHLAVWGALHNPRRPHPHSRQGLQGGVAVDVPYSSRSFIPRDCMCARKRPPSRMCLTESPCTRFLNLTTTSRFMKFISAAHLTTATRTGPTPFASRPK